MARCMGHLVIGISHAYSYAIPILIISKLIKNLISGTCQSKMISDTFPRLLRQSSKAIIQSALIALHLLNLALCQESYPVLPDFVTCETAYGFAADFGACHIAWASRPRSEPQALYHEAEAKADLTNLERFQLLLRYSSSSMSLCMKDWGSRHTCLLLTLDAAGKLSSCTIIIDAFLLEG